MLQIYHKHQQALLLYYILCVYTSVILIAEMIIKRKKRTRKKRSEKIGIFQIKILVCVKTVPWKKKQSFLLLK